MTLTTGRPDTAPQPELAAPKLSRTLRAAHLPADLRKQIPLSDRELNVMLLTRAGLQAKEVAAKLGMTPRTAETHPVNVRKRLGDVPLLAVVLMLDRLLHKEGL